MKILKTLGILISNVKECFCGNTPPAEADLTKESACNQKCPGDSSKICGASWRMNVYETGNNENQKDPRFNQSIKMFTTQDMKVGWP